VTEAGREYQKNEGQAGRRLKSGNRPTECSRISEKFKVAKFGDPDERLKDIHCDRMSLHRYPNGCPI
jgi:hypothetical protein